MEEARKDRRREENTRSRWEKREEERLSCEVRMRLDMEDEDPLAKLAEVQEAHATTRQQLEQARKDLNAEKERVRRRDATIDELETKLAEKKTSKEKSGQSGGRPAWSPIVVLLAMCLRSAGVGARTTGRLVSFVFLLLLGEDVDPVPRSTIQTWDKSAGQLSMLLLLQTLRDLRPLATTWSQDASSGSRHSWGCTALLWGLGGPTPLNVIRW